LSATTGFFRAFTDLVDILDNYEERFCQMGRGRAPQVHRRIYPTPPQEGSEDTLALPSSEISTLRRARAV